MWESWYQWSTSDPFIWFSVVGWLGSMVIVSNSFTCLNLEQTYQTKRQLQTGLYFLMACSLSIAFGLTGFFVGWVLIFSYKRLIRRIQNQVELDA